MSKLIGINKPQYEKHIQVTDQELADKSFMKGLLLALNVNQYKVIDVDGVGSVGTCIGCESIVLENETYHINLESDIVYCDECYQEMVKSESKG